MKIRETTGFTLVELLVVVAILATILAVSAPGLIRARMSGNEASAIGSLRSINQAESSYSSSCGHGGFAQSLADLVKAPAGTNNGFISPDLSTNGVAKSGFIVNLQADPSAVIITAAGGTCNGSAGAAVSLYFAEDHPITVSLTGQRSFATDSRGTIFFKDDGSTIAAGMAGASTLP
jgi:type IV pilus assembly protein PilA